VWPDRLQKNLVGPPPGSAPPPPVSAIPESAPTSSSELE
jgi:hypothetical protein